MSTARPSSNLSPGAKLFLFSALIIGGLAIGYVVAYYTHTSWRWDMRLFPRKSSWVVRMGVKNYSPSQTITFTVLSATLNGKQGGVASEPEDIPHGMKQDFDIVFPKDASAPGENGHFYLQYRVYHPFNSRRETDYPGSGGFRWAEEDVVAEQAEVTSPPQAGPADNLPSFWKVVFANPMMWTSTAMAVGVLIWAFVSVLGAKS